MRHQWSCMQSKHLASITHRKLPLLQGGLPVARHREADGGAAGSHPAAPGAAAVAVAAAPEAGGGGAGSGTGTQGEYVVHLGNAMLRLRQIVHRSFSGCRLRASECALPCLQPEMMLVSDAQSRTNPEHTCLYCSAAAASPGDPRGHLREGRGARAGAVRTVARRCSRGPHGRHVQAQDTGRCLGCNRIVLRPCSSGPRSSADRRSVDPLPADIADTSA